MRILQITSDWKWTGPAEPMLLLAGALRDLGHQVLLSCPEPPLEADRSLAEQARAAGFAPGPVLERARGARWRRDTADANAVAATIARNETDIIHTWHTRDHALALRASRSRRRAGVSALVRTLPSADPVPATPWNRWLLGPGSDGVACVGAAAAAGNERLRGGRPLVGCAGAVDLKRWSTEPKESLRPKLGIETGDFVIGVVARVQRHRRFDLIFESMAELARTHPRAKLLVLGRGTHFEEVASEPVRRAGLSDRVILAGYRGPDYSEALRCIDVLTFLVPGSDGSCRAVLEAAACGIPTVATRRGALAEIVRDGETGILVRETGAELRNAWARMAEDPRLCARLGAGALAHAQREFAPSRYARDMERLYRESLEQRRARTKPPRGDVSAMSPDV